MRPVSGRVDPSEDHGAAWRWSRTSQPFSASLLSPARHIHRRASASAGRTHGGEQEPSIGGDARRELVLLIGRQNAARSGVRAGLQRTNRNPVVRSLSSS